MNKALSTVGRMAKKKRTWATISAVGMAGVYFADGRPLDAFRSLLTFFGV